MANTDWDMNLAIAHLANEQNAWVNYRPIGFEFWLTADLFIWEAVAPSVADRDWEGGVFGVQIQFNTFYPREPRPC